MAELPSEQLRALLREWMRRFGLNRRQTARALEVREHSVKTVLGGHEPNVDLADTLCRGIGPAGHRRAANRKNALHYQHLC